MAVHSISLNDVLRSLVFTAVLVASCNLAQAQVNRNDDYRHTVSISTWLSLENPVTGIKYQNNSNALGYFVNVKTDLDKFMAVAGPAFKLAAEHYLFLGAGTFDGVLALELGVTIQRRKMAFELGLDYVPDDKFNFLIPTIGIGLNF